MQCYPACRRRQMRTTGAARCSQPSDHLRKLQVSCPEADAVYPCINVVSCYGLLGLLGLLLAFSLGNSRLAVCWELEISDGP